MTLAIVLTITGSVLFAATVTVIVHMVREPLVFVHRARRRRFRHLNREDS